MTVIDAARDYLSRGWMPIPVPHKSKAPVMDCWPQFRITEDEVSQHFNGKALNVGVLLGEPSGDLIDIDLDCKEAVALAPLFLSDTSAVFGRPSKPRSHWVFTAQPLPKTTKFLDVDGSVLLELRSTGCQTIFPGSVHPSGEAIEWHEQAQPTDVSAGDLMRACGRLAVAALLARHWPDRGSRHDAALALAGGVLRAGLSRQEPEAFIQAVADAGNSEPGHKHVEVVSLTADKLARGEEVTGWPRLAELLRGDGRAAIGRVRKWLGCGAVAAEFELFHLTDTGNAQRLAARHQERIRYWHQSDQSGCWLVWSGTRWQRDPDGTVVRLAKETAASILAKAAQEKDEDKRKSILAWAMVSESATRIRSMLQLAESEEALAIATHQLDADPWLLNVENGTMDLRTGELRQHRREDLITKLAPVVYDPSAAAPQFKQFLSEIMQQDDGLMEYLQRLFGMCLTGDINEQTLPILWGSGGNGKNVLTDTVKGMMGDYAADAPPDLLVVRKNDEHPTEIADLMGRRLVVASETEEGKLLRIQFVKRLTGDRTLKGRFMRQGYFEFARTHKTILITNNKPVVREGKHAIWRRLRLVPFMFQVPEAKVDKKLTEKLKEDWPGILRWCVDGCRKWQEAGQLAEPEQITQATEQYRAEQDVLTPFLEECCVVAPRAEVSRREIWEAYQNWVHRTGERWPLDRNGLYERLRLPGFTEGSFREHGTSVRGFIGLGLAAPPSGDDEGDAV